MELPDFLSPEFRFLSKAADAESAFSLLKEKPVHQQTLFFIECSDYTSWIKESGRELMVMLLLSFEKQIEGGEAKAILRALQKNYALFKDALPFDIRFLVEEKEIPAHRILFSLASPFFAKCIQEAQGKKTIPLQMSQKEFSLFEEFIYKGEIHLLVRETPETILDLIRRALKIEMEPLAEYAAEGYKRYIDRDQLLTMLKMARLENLQPLEKASLEMVNESGLGVELHPLVGGGFSLQIHFLSEEAKALIKQIGKEIREVKAEELSEILLELPKVAALDLSGSKGLDPKSLPPSIVRLNLSECEWLTDEKFLAIVKMLPKLTHLDLSKNLSLTFRSFAELQRLQRLTSLSISNCRQIGDEEFQLILESVPRLTHLEADELTLSDAALEGLKGSTGLQQLSLRSLSGTTGEWMMGLKEALPYIEKIDLRCTRGLSSLYLDKAMKLLPINF